MILLSSPRKCSEEALPRAPYVSAWPFAVLRIPLICLVLASFLTLGSSALRSSTPSDANLSPAIVDPERIRYVPLDSSRFVIEGRTNVHGFTCVAERVDGFGHLPNDRSNRTNPYPIVPDVDVQLEVPVRALECGKSRMNRDLYQTLKADQYPHIRFTLSAVTVRDTPTVSEKRGTYRLEVSGTLTIADSTRHVRFDVVGHRPRPGVVHGKGSTHLEMSSFGIDPPSALMGLIQVRDKITVRFDLAAKAASADGDQLGFAEGE